jgi:hypothetical protein
MTVKIKVVDRYNRPVEGTIVNVLWGGTSSRRVTNSNGIADLGCSGGIAKLVSIDGKKVDKNCYLKDGLISYPHPSK